MSVRSSLLAILDQGPCYGYQLRAEFHRRTGRGSPLNVGQIYNTLDRLERDGLVSRGDTDEQGHVYYMITDAGSTEVRDWLGTTVARPASTRDELPLKLALAAALPGVDVTSIVALQRAATHATLESLRHAADPGPGAAAGQDAGAAGSPNGETLARQLVADALVFQAEAELRWLDRVAERLAEHPARALALDLGTERPRRGRPPQIALPIA